MTLPLISMRQITKRFPGVIANNKINLELYPGEIHALLGENGSGKSTLLRCLNKLETINRGTIIIDGELLADTSSTGEVVYAPGDESRRIACKMGMVFQQFNLFPHMTVLQNLIEAPVQVQKRDRAQVIEEAKILLGKVGLSEKADVYPRKLSGGQQQRVGIARAFAANPPIVLMDEPFSALDPMTRAELQNEIHDLQTKAQKTVVFVTHDMDEAIKLADRICIIQDGKVAQCDTPENILKHPANQYVTEFIGANRLWANPEYIRAADIMRRLSLIHI